MDPQTLVPSEFNSEEASYAEAKYQLSFMYKYLKSAFHLKLVGFSLALLCGIPALRIFYFVPMGSTRFSNLPGFEETHFKSLQKRVKTMNMFLKVCQRGFLEKVLVKSESKDRFELENFLNGLMCWLHNQLPQIIIDCKVTE